MKIVIPTYKRAGRAITADLIPSASLCIHECEVEAYRQSYAAHNLVIAPDSLRGNIAAVRNFILDQFDDDVLMLDDDLEYIGRVEGGEWHRLDQAQIMRMITDGFELAREFGVSLWGVNTNNDRASNREYSPFSTQAPVLGTFCGILKGCELRYDERIPLKEDFDYFLQHLLKYRKVLRFNAYHYGTRHIVGEGGCISYRTMDKERECADLLVKKWGSKIVQVDFARSLNPIIKSPLSGI